MWPKLILLPLGATISLAQGATNPSLAQEVNSPAVWTKVDLLNQTPICSVALSPTGNELACGDENGAIYVLSFPSLQLIDQFSISRAPVYPLAYSPDGANLISSMAEMRVDPEIIVIDAKRRRPRTFFANSFGPARAIAFSPDGDKAVVICDPGIRRDGDAPAGIVAISLGSQRVIGRRACDDAPKGIATHKDSFYMIFQSGRLSCDSWAECDPRNSEWLDSLYENSKQADIMRPLQLAADEQDRVGGLCTDGDEFFVLTFDGVTNQLKRHALPERFYQAQPTSGNEWLLSGARGLCLIQSDSGLLTWRAQSRFVKDIATDDSMKVIFIATTDGLYFLKTDLNGLVAQPSGTPLDRVRSPAAPHLPADGYNGRRPQPSP